MSAPRPALEVEVLGARVAVRLPPASVEAATTAWSGCRPAEAGPPYDMTLDLRDHALGEPWIAQDLARHLTAAAIEHQAGRRLLLHAACVAAPRTGRGVVLVGASGAGKTTAAIHLCRNGFEYVTDETVAVDEAGLAMLYPKPVSVAPAHPGGVKAQHAPELLGMSVAREPRPVGAVLLLSRAEQHRTPSLASVPLLDAMSDLIGQTSSLPALEHPLTRLADHVRAAGGVRRLHYRDIADAVDLMEQVAAEPADSAPTATVHRPTARPRPEGLVRGDASALGPDAVLRRGNYTEAVEDAGEVLVLVGDAPVRLAGIGATVWLAGERPRTLSELVDRCVRRHGHVDAADRRVLEVARELVQTGLLVAGRR